MKVGQNADKKKILDELLELGMVLVAIDARVSEVDVPDHLSVDPQLRLNLSWRFGRFMEVDPWGIQAELTFGGVPYACKFPWNAVFLLVSHVNGESYLFPDHVPKELLHQATEEHQEGPTPVAKPRAKSAKARPKLSLVTSADGGHEPEPKAADADAAHAPTAQKPLALEPQAKPKASPKGGSTEPPNDDGPSPSPQTPARGRGHLRLVK